MNSPKYRLCFFIRHNFVCYYLSDLSDPGISIGHALLPIYFLINTELKYVESRHADLAVLGF